MKLKDLYEKIKHNHALMILLCCAVPLILLYGAVSFFGLSNNYLYWLIILLCPAMHFWMMKDMHKKHHGEEEQGKYH